MTGPSTFKPPLRAAPLHFDDGAERLSSFAHAIDALRADIEARVGQDDVAYMRGVRSFSVTMEITGRALIHFSLEPVSFVAGVLVLSVHKGLELMEIGHTVLHGAYDRVPECDGLRSKTFRWRAPIDEESWRKAHNVRHHQYTNIAGRDPDLDFGGLRLSERIPHRALHRLQPVSNLVTWAAFATAINLHVTGLLDVYLRRGSPPQLEDHTPGAFVEAHRRFLRAALRYGAREYLMFPALSGPLFWKTALGNLLSDVACNLYAGATIYCGHVGAYDHAASARADGRASFYVMQAEGACNFEVPLLVSILCGGLDHQIEHHLFPRLPPNRLREIAPRVREICEQHGVRYHTGTWPRRLGEIVRTLHRLRRNVPAPTAGARARAHA